MNIIFLDIDGVLNCQLFYTETHDKEGLTYTEANICKTRVSWLNELCNEMDIKVVISSTWRMGRTVEELKEIMSEAGATFDVIDKTPVFRDSDTVRGNEIQRWIKDNKELLGVNYYDFYTYAIIDDDSDMLLQQRDNFFQTDTYSGLTPNTVYRIKRHFEKTTAFHNPIEI